MKIVVLNQKGGVGKSTVTVNLGYGLAAAGRRTLVIDLDPQAHSTVIYTAEVPKSNTVNELFQDRKFDVRDAARPAVVWGASEDGEEVGPVENLFLMPANIHLAASSERIISRTHREKIFHNQIRKIEADYDFILVDCPPTLGVLTVNAIYTADLILIPTNYSKYSLDGISDLFASIAEVKESGEYRYRILRNSKDTRNTRTNEAIEGLLADFQENLLRTIIRRSEAINQAQMQNQPIFVFDPRSIGAADFSALTEEILQYGQEETGR
ncbi:MAG: ParA family protein [Desulfococcaceae bacterium]